MGQYKQKFTVATPGYIVIMLDQSSSMDQPYTLGYTRAEYAAFSINNVIEALIMKCDSGRKNKCAVAVYGYGNSQNQSVRLLKAGNIAEWAAENPNPRSYRQEKKSSDGIPYMEENIVREWIKPYASGETPTKEAFDKIYRDTRDWIDKNPNSFPPVVIHITDGDPNEYWKDKTFENTTKSAKKLQSLTTQDGELILMNVFISVDNNKKFVLPASDYEFDFNPRAKFLFDISSVLPKPMIERASIALQDTLLQEGSRGFIFNASANDLTKLLIFGSTVGF